MIRSNSKVYKFKICIDGYTLDYAQKYIDKNILNNGFVNGILPFV